jgi:hypothetical protein
MRAHAIRKARQPIVLGMIWSGTEPVSSVVPIAADIKRCRNGEVPPDTDLPVSSFVISNRAAQGGVGAGFDLTLAAGLTNPGLYCCDMTYTVSGMPDRSSTVFIEIEGSVT